MTPLVPMLLHKLAVLITALTLAACGGAEHVAPVEPPSVALPVVTASKAEVALGDLASGTVVADERVQLAARTAGTVRAPGLHEGQPVRAGQVLVTIDAQQAEGAVQQARAALHAAQAQQRQADADVARNEPLARAGGVSRTDLEQDQLRAQVVAAAVEQARAAMAIAEANRRDQRVTSPIDGAIITRHVRDGDIVQPGVLLLTVEGRDQLLFRFSAPQASLHAFAPGATVPVLIDEREDQPVTGTVRAIVPSADPATRRYTVEISLPPDSALLAGMFGRVRLPANSAHSATAVTIPAAALTEQGGLTGVFVVGKDERLAFRWLRLTERFGDQVLVTSGLAAGEQVLARIDPSVRDGAHLVPVVPAQ